MHSAQAGNIGQPTRILPRWHGHRRLPETPAARQQHPGCWEGRKSDCICWEEGKLRKKKKIEGLGGSKRGDAEHAGTADLVCSRGGDNAGKRTSISAHPPPFLVRPAKFLGEGRCYLPPASLAGAWLLRRAARSSGPAGIAAVPGVRPPAARPNPPAGPPSMAVYQCRQPADDSASFSRAPASSWHPGIDATAAGTLSRMLPRNAEASGAPVRMAPQPEEPAAPSGTRAMPGAITEQPRRGLQLHGKGTRQHPALQIRPRRETFRSRDHVAVPCAKQALLTHACVHRQPWSMSSAASAPQSENETGPNSLP